MPPPPPPPPPLRILDAVDCTGRAHREVCNERKSLKMVQSEERKRLWKLKDTRLRTCDEYVYHIPIPKHTQGKGTMYPR